MGLFLLGAFCMFLTAYVAHRYSVQNLGEAFVITLKSHTEEAYKYGKMQGHIEVMSVLAEQADPYVYEKVSEGIDFNDLHNRV